MINFTPQKRVVNYMSQLYTDIELQLIKAEPMFYRASVSFAKQHGESLTRRFLQLLPTGWENGIIDSRTHMLMPGWYPCIPGWHLDDIPRTRPDNQPDHANPSYLAEHICMILGDASKTEFLDSPVSLEDVPVGGGVVYDKWNKDINELIKAGRAKTSYLVPGQLMQFGYGDFHRGSPATKFGFRWFIRITRNTHLSAVNEIRKNANVYMSALDAGW